jgi:transposase
MLDPNKRKAVLLLHEEGMSLREMARRLHISRRTLRRIVEHPEQTAPRPRKRKVELDEELLRRLYAACDGRIERVREKLIEEHRIPVKYSTLTQRLRELQISAPLTTRCERVPDEPGAEMQHDTSVYTLRLGERSVKAVASLLYLRYSKRRYLKFYPSFNRFRMKCFLHEALVYWGYSARECIIDNTNLARLRGQGSNAVIVPEMVCFARQYGFTFRCHALGHANRKAGEERSFWTVETNFLTGRTFRDWEDLNRQAFEWATVRLYHRPVAKSRLIPAQAFEHERTVLIPVSPHLCAPYLDEERLIDQYGYVACEGNFYWVPGTDRQWVKILRYDRHLEIHAKGHAVLSYPLPPEGLKNGLFSPKGQPKPPHQPRSRRKRTQQEEARLRAMGETVVRYLDFALQPKGLDRHRMLRELYALSRQTSPEIFEKTLLRALQYRIADIPTVRRIALLLLSDQGGTLPDVEIDEGFRERESYREGHLTDVPDLSAYDRLLDEPTDASKDAPASDEENEAHG